LNVWLFAAVLLFVLIAGWSGRLPVLAMSGLGDYAATFAPRSLGHDVDVGWHRQWTIFNWANWFAWAPVTALFLGRLALGNTVRGFILFNLLLPALFGAIWMIVIAGTTIGLDQQSSGSLYALLTSAGPDPLLYRLFSELGGGTLILILLIAAIFLSYVTAADSNISAMSALSTYGISPEAPEAPLPVKIVWGATVGLIATILVGSSGIDGIRMMSVLGGFPALFVIIGAALSLTVIAVRGRREAAPAQS
jgi:choline-glycine betaine transporter